jgi:hypothetical protein
MVDIILAKTETTTIARNLAESPLEVHRTNNKLVLNVWKFLMSCLVFSNIDDPYYCGLRARIPNFVRKKKKPEATSSKNQQPPVVPHPNQQPMMGHPLGKNQPQMTSHPFWWHSRLYSDNSGQFSKKKTS